MNDYVPRFGDRVRATLGENVLVGHWGRGILLNQICLDSGQFISQEWDGWKFEQVVELPTKTGAIVSNNISGDAYVLAPYGSPGGQYIWYGLSGHSAGAYVGPVPVTDGGFTIEFEGIG